MRYIIMAGGEYNEWNYPRQLSLIHGETLIGRTIRLLKENGVTEIAVSSNNKELRTMLRDMGVSVTFIVHKNDYISNYNDVIGSWVNCFCPIVEPTCFLFGDVVYSPEAIKKIVETETNSIEFFASAPPFAKNYCKEWAEPFAFKVFDTVYFKDCIQEVKKLQMQRKFKRSPIAWELWQVIKKTPLNEIDYTNYTVINDYTCDIDLPKDICKFEGGEEWHTT